jgi:hypothetical protein
MFGRERLGRSTPLAAWQNPCFAVVCERQGEHRSICYCAGIIGLLQPEKERKKIAAGRRQQPSFLLNCMSVFE